MSDLDVLIDELVVHGTRVDRAAIRSAMEDELQRLFTDDPTLGLRGERPVLRLELPDRLAGAAELGRAVALALHEALRA